MHQGRNQFGRETKWETGDASRRFRYEEKAELCRDERSPVVDGLFRDDDERPNRLTGHQVMQQHMREFSRLLAKGGKERQEKRSVTSCVCGDMGPSPDRLKGAKPY